MNRFELFKVFRSEIASLDTELSFEIPFFDCLESILFSAIVHQRTINDNIAGNISLKERVSEAATTRLEKYIIKPAKARRNPSIAQADVIFYPVEENHLPQMLPVAHLLAQKGKRILFITDRHQLLPDIKAGGFTPYYIHLDNNDTEPVATIDNQIKQAVYNCNTPKARAHIYTTTAYSYWHRYNELCKNLRLVFSQASPAVIVVGYDITFEGRTASFIAKNENVTSACIMHGSVAGEPLDSTHIVDAFFIYGKVAANDLLKLGHRPDQLKVTGAIYLDDKKIEVDKRILNEVGRSVYNLIAISGYGGSTTKGHYFKLLEAYFDLAKQFPQEHFVFKLHKKERVQDYKELIKTYNLRNISIVQYEEKKLPTDIFSWLKNAKTLLTGTSTTALEAMYMNVPVITLDLEHEYTDCEFIAAGTTLHSTNHDSLQTNFKSAISRDAKCQNKMAAAQLYSNDFFDTSKEGTSAASRCCDMIMNIIDEQCAA